jgi:hypothetical protein
MAIKYAAPESSADMKDLVERFEKDGTIENHQAAHALQIHLVAVNYYEKNGSSEKVIKHLKGFNVLLNHQKKENLISDEVYNVLKADTAYLIEKYQ